MCLAPLFPLEVLSNTDAMTTVIDFMHMLVRCKDRLPDKKISEEFHAVLDTARDSRG